MAARRNSFALLRMRIYVLRVVFTGRLTDCIAVVAVCVCAAFAVVVVMAMLLMERNGTVTVCHSRTKNTAEICRNADIIVVAIGKAEFLRSDMVKEGAVVIDVGINRLADGKLVGDVCFDEVNSIASMITPVPGGVGPMTITMLLYNTLSAAKLQK